MLSLLKRWNQLKTRTSNSFVYGVVGDAHVEQVNRSLRFLKQFSREQIVVLAARHDICVDHDQVIEAEFPAQFDDHQASILLKTGLHHWLDLGDRTWCYLDSDVFAVHEAVDDIFKYSQQPIVFAADNIPLSTFSRYAVRCACSSGCDHLRDAVATKFGVEMPAVDWQHWNGGVFVFGAYSIEFFNTWHAYTEAILNDPQWRTRDQGTLAATVWKFGLQNQRTLPAKFNYIVDGMRHLNDAERATATPQTYSVDDRYSLERGSPTHPAFLHFIGHTSKRGWRNWDEAEAKLSVASKPVGRELSFL